MLSSHKYKHKKYEYWLKLDSGFVLQPQLVSLNMLENGGVQTISTIEISHDELISKGVFEYQHSTGDDLANSIVNGFKGWIDLDLVVFIDALSQNLENCTSLEMEFPETETRKVHNRRVVLGSPSYLVTDKTVQENEEHPFCPCCLFTNSFDAFQGLLESEEFYGVRMFAMRNEEGLVEADCRVNGEDWELGKMALIKYAKTWPNLGFECRKQYVCIQSRDVSSTSPAMS